MDGFTGKSQPLDSDGLQSAIDALGANAAQLWAVIGVETSGCGYLSDRRPKILFERHIFRRVTGGRFDATNPSLSNPTPGGYGPGGATQYERLASAMALDRQPALESCSWGIGQVMGFNAQSVGFTDVEQMVGRMSDSENAQVGAMAAFIKASGLDGALRSQDWKRFARGYNGSDFQINAYDVRLASAFEHASHGGMPDLAVRALQVYLTFLRHDPNGIDGIMGRRTRAAMNEYQATKGLPLTEFVDDATLAALRADCGSEG
jgi:hypothetical protein